MADDSTSNLHRLAINAALTSNWDQAIDYNRELIKTEPENVDCLNRLAKAYLELGKYSSAKKIYNEVLKLDPYNTIAQKNLKKVTSFKVGQNDNIKSPTQNNAKALNPSSFLEEPGKTKIVTLVKAAEPNKLVLLSAGHEVNLVTKNRGISVTDADNQYLGVLPDDTAHHLLKLIRGGNKYQALIKAFKANSLTLLIREVYRSKKFKNQASFLDSSRILTYSSDNILIGSSEVQEELEEQLDTDESSV